VTKKKKLLIKFKNAYKMNLSQKSGILSKNQPFSIEVGNRILTKKAAL